MELKKDLSILLHVVSVFLLDFSGVYSCNEDRLRAPDGTRMLIFDNNRYAIFECIPGHQFQSQTVGIVWCDQDTDEWVGEFTPCLKKDNPCYPNPCLNNGECDSNEDPYGYGFFCHCRRELQGKLCEREKYDPCLPNPCLNDGECDSNDDPYGYGFFCRCKGKVEGKLCEIDKPNLCVPNPCMNNGACYSNEDPYGMGFFCHCTRDVKGKLCEIEKTDPCLPNPCLNNGVCYSNDEDPHGMGFYCHCRGQIGGMLCDIVNPCALFPCPHGPDGTSRCHPVAYAKKGRVCYSSDWTLLD